MSGGNTVTAGYVAEALKQTPQAIKRRAKKESWPYTEEPVRGGKRRRYAVATLPQDVQIAIADQAIKTATPEKALPTVTPTAPPAITGTPSGVPAIANLAQWQFECGQARACVLDEVSRMAETIGFAQAEKRFCDLAAAGELPPDKLAIVRLANARQGEGRTLSPATLWLWRKTIKGIATPISRVAALAPRGRGMQWTLAPDVLQVLALYRQANKPTLAWCVKEFLRGNEGDFNALYKRVDRQIKKMPQQVFYIGRNTGASLRALQPFRRRAYNMLLPNDVWIGDGHGAKLRIAHPETGRPFVPEVTVILDVQSRYAVGWSVALSENRLAVSDALRHGMANHGLPLIYYSDNGAGQTADMLDAPLTGILPVMGVHHETGIPGNPQGRGIIERFWQTLLIPLARRFATFQGKSADRDTLRQISIGIDRQIRAVQRMREQGVMGEVIPMPDKLPTFNQFIDTLSAEIEHYNNHHQHKALGGATPAQARAAKLAEAEIFRPPAQELAGLFMPSTLRKAQRGEVRLWNGIYTSKDLMLVDNEQVRVHFDIHDASYVLVKRMSGEVIARAELNGSSSDYFPKPYIEQLRDDRAKRRLALQESKVEAIREEHGARTVYTTGAREPLPISAEEAAHAARIENDMKVIELRQRDDHDNDEWAPLRRCIAIGRRIDAGEPVSDADVQWRDSYMRSADYRTMSRMAQDWPEMLEQPEMRRVG